MKQSLIDREDFRINTFDTGVSGITLCLVGGVHGNETCGLDAINLIESKLSKELTLRQGRLVTIVANNQAIRQKKRFLDYDLNRAFDSTQAFGHELDLAQKLKPFLHSIDYLVDLHSTSAPTTPFGAGKLTQEHLNFFSFTGVEIYTHGWAVHREYSMLIDEVDRFGGIGIIVECGQNEESNTSQVAGNVLLSVLEGLNMIDSWKSHRLKNTTIIKLRNHQG